MPAGLPSNLILRGLGESVIFLVEEMRSRMLLEPLMHSVCNDLVAFTVQVDGVR